LAVLIAKHRIDEELKAAPVAKGGNPRLMNAGSNGPLVLPSKSGRAIAVSISSGWLERRATS
jgi:hypothetical protein